MCNHATGVSCACQSAYHTKTANPQPDPQYRTLTGDIGRDGQRWTQARLMADVVSAAYRRDPDERVRRWGARIADCGQHITIAYDPEGDGYRRQVVQANLCRVRTCPICAWRRAEKLAADIGQRIRTLCAPGGLIPLMLTLTVRNCHVSDLRETVRSMLSGWSRLRKRTLLVRCVAHWTRSIEVTRGRQHIPGDTHPHMHCILLAHPDDAAVLLSADWSSMWSDVMRLDYVPVTHVMPLDVSGNVAEPLKYTVKPHGLEQHAVSGWLASVAIALDGIRVFACDEGLRVHEPSGDDLGGGELVDDVPEGVHRPPARAPLSIVYHWSGRNYLRGCITIGYGAAEIRALQLMTAAAYRRR